MVMKGVIMRRDSRESLKPGAGRSANKGANVNVCKERGNDYRIKGEEVVVLKNKEDKHESGSYY